MPNIYSPSQSPSSMYSHAPTVIHHGAHRSALARKATRQLANWAESPTSSATHGDDLGAAYYSRPTQEQSASSPYTYNGNYSTDYAYEYDAAPEQEHNDAPSSADHLSSVRAGPTVRKYADLNFDDDTPGTGGTIGYAQVGRRDKAGTGGGEWGTPESTLAGIGRQATRMMRAATTKKGTAAAAARERDMPGLGLELGGHSGSAKGYSTTISPSQSVDSRGSGSGSGSSKQRFGDFLGTLGTSTWTARQRDHPQQLYSSGSKLSIASDQSANTASSDSSVGEAVITPNLSSAFTSTPYYDASSKYAYPSRTTSTSVVGTTPAKAPTISSSGRTYRTAASSSAAGKDTALPTPGPALAPSAQIYDPATNSNTLSGPSPALFTLSPTPTGFAATDRPLLSSGSPGFGLISLEAAQQRERTRLGGAETPAPAGHIRGGATPRIPAVPKLPTAAPAPAPATQTQKLKNKKSLISLIRSATSYATGSAPPIPGGSSKKMHIGEPLPLIRVPVPGELTTPTPATAMAMARYGASGEGYDPVEAWVQGATGAQGNDTAPDGQYTSISTSRKLAPGPKLELRPVSMMLASGLPEDYLAPSSTASSGIDDTFAHAHAHDGRSSVFTASSSLSSAISGAPSALDTDPDAAAPAPAPTPAPAEVLALRRELANLRKTHQIQASELSSQLREARDELQAALLEAHELRTEREAWAPKEDGCAECGCTCGMAVSEMLMGSAPSPSPRPPSGSARARSGTTTTTRSLRSVKSIRSRQPSDRSVDVAGIPVPAIPASSDWAGQAGGGGGRGVMDRARVKTGGARGVFGTGSLYEWE